MKFVFFRFRRTEKNGLGDDGADGAIHPQNFGGIEPPLSSDSLLLYIRVTMLELC